MGGLRTGQPRPLTASHSCEKQSALDTGASCCLNLKLLAHSSFVWKLDKSFQCQSQPFCPWTSVPDLRYRLHAPSPSLVRSWIYLWLQPQYLCELCTGNFDALLEWTSWYRVMLCQYWWTMQLRFSYRFIYRYFSVIYVAFWRCLHRVLSVYFHCIDIYIPSVLCVGYNIVWSGLCECNEHHPLQTML